MRRDRINSLIDALLTEAECYEDEMYRLGYTDALTDLKDVINADFEMALSILEGEGLIRLNDADSLMQTDE